MNEISHSEAEGNCFRLKIAEIAEICDNEYYMSAGGPDLGNRDRAIRGHARIILGIKELLSIKERASCEACIKEIEKQLELQYQGLSEVESVWGIKRSQE